MNSIRVFVRNMSKARKWEPLNRVGIIGVPFEKGQKKYGVSVAPAAMRAAGLVEQLKEIGGLDVKDFGDIEVGGTHDAVTVDNMAHLPLVSECNRQLSKRVSEVLRDDRVVVTIGGDHSIGVGTVDGHHSVNEDMILIWVDAHADINTNKTSGSGSVHGMPVALLVRELADYWPYLPTMDWQVPKFSIKNLGYVGLRSVDTYERLAIEKYDVPAFAMEDIEKHGIQNSIGHILHVLDPNNSKPIHVSFDIDSLDALEAPSTGTPVRGGLTLREAICLMELIHSTGRLRAVDLVEINPALGNDSDRRKTLEAGLSVLRAALGFSRRGTAPRGVLDLPVQTHHQAVQQLIRINLNIFVEIFFTILQNRSPKNQKTECVMITQYGGKMIEILIFTVMITTGLSLEPEQEGPDEEIKKILNKYVNTIPDLPPKYVINEGLTNLISKYYKGKLTTFPLYKISLKIDRKPVRIPWTLGAPSDHNEAKSGKKYTFVKVNRPEEAKK